MQTFTVFYKAQVNGGKFLASTAISADSKEAAAEWVLKNFAHATEVTSVMVGR